MFLINLIFVFVFALLLASILALAFGWRHPARAEAFGVSLLFLFIVFFLAIWAGAVWIQPWGPVLYGVPWLSMFLIGLFVALLILSLTPDRSSRVRSEVVDEMKEVKVNGTVFTVFFWILCIGLLIAIIIAAL